MPGIFDGMRISTSGIRTYRILEEVISQNIANASNENYSRQQVRLDTLGAIFDGKHFLGQGVKATDIVRVRDELLDEQLRGSASAASTYTYKLQWLEKIQSVFNEPSDNSINATLSKFWEAWSELAADPQSLATRSNVIARTSNLTNLLNTIDSKLEQYEQNLDQELLQEIGTINALTDEIAKLNADIFEIEAGKTAKANDLRDRRDAALDKLSESVNISYYEDSNGMINVSFGSHPAVLGDRAERLVAKNNPLDASKLRIMWEYGDRLSAVQRGNLAAILEVRDIIIGDYRSKIDTLAQTLITEVNKIYANGTGLQPHTLMESRLGYEALGVAKSTDALNLVSTGQTGEMHISFYDSSDNIVRVAGIVIDAGDSLQDIAQKLDNIAGLNAALLTGTHNDGRLSLSLDTLSGDNVLGEVSFTISNNTGGYDTTGFLNLLNFNQTDKSTNTSAVQPLLTSRDLTELQTILGEPNVADVRSKALNMSGTFTINAFETGTETPPATDGHLVQQFVIQVESSDSIDSIMAKINNLTAKHGIAITFNGATNQLELTSAAQTDSEGNVLLAGGSDYLRLGFANTYRHPIVANDIAPINYNELGDNTNLLAALQLNTLFQGSTASDISIDTTLIGPSQIHAGYNLSSGDNTMALDLIELQHALVTENNQFTLGEYYGNTIAAIGTAVMQTQTLSNNEAAMLEGYHTERDRMSGVNMDEELSHMIMFQRAYEANARMFATFNQMAEDLLKLI